MFAVNFVWIFAACRIVQSLHAPAPAKRLREQERVLLLSQVRDNHKSFADRLQGFRGEALAIAPSEGGQAHPPEVNTVDDPEWDIDTFRSLDTVPFGDIQTGFHIRRGTIS